MERKRNQKRKSVDSPTINISKGQCPVCFQIPRANIFQCANGHSMCDLCSTRLTICPTCQSPGVSIRNLFAESFLDDIEFNCSWNQQGCDLTMKRSELSTHQENCDHNPEIIKFCSKFPEARNCSYNFTSKWLSESKNCNNFKTHVQTCLNVIHFTKHQYGKPFFYIMNLEDMLLMKKFSPKRLAHHSYPPYFFRLPSQNENKEHLLALFILLKVDGSGNQSLSFAFVQLTPQTTQMVVEIQFPGNPTSKMVSQHGQDSLPSINWTQKPMSFNRFLDMVKNSPNSTEPEIPFPFSLPVSFLSEYYSSEDKKQLNVLYTVELTS